MMANTPSTRHLPLCAAGRGVIPVTLVVGLLLRITTTDAFSVTAFRSASRHQWRSVWTQQTNVVLFSSVGDGNGGGGGSNDGDDLGDFLDPMKKPDSENMKRAREYMSETSLPISFDSIIADDGTDAIDETVDEIADKANDVDAESKDVDLMSDQPSSSSLISSSSSSSSGSENATSSTLFGGGGDGDGELSPPSPSLLAKNPYMQVVSKISPSDLISKFTAESDPRVQEAVRTTILGLIGSLPKMAFETTSITTGQRLASLMFQLQMTGYMFKNAEYRLSMSQSLGMSSSLSSNFMLKGVEEELPDKEDDPLVSGKIKGKLKIRYRKRDADTDTEEVAKTTASDDVEAEDGMEIEVDAAAYMSELRDEVSRLRDELTEKKETKDEALKQDLLLYIRTLPAQELKSLTNTMSQDVLVCMKGLVQAVLAGIGDGKIGPDTVTEQSGEAMAQLCMWQLAVGYNLRELEVREEMKKNMMSLMGDSSADDSGLSDLGAFE
ncbi:unnamed protein product [Pseudo-nitzschia multistriata]|uniref:Uncharacterized protein n=1 Tax=Pseudo-nitzschia multistriata TaxID=183589 RepID=A0A448YUG1_9STRA|nr:unnamed protein product [Pseudo-nitzschia multistriata]